MKKSQIANEFVIVMGIAILVLLIFISLQAGDFEQIGTTKRTKSIDDFGKALQREVFIASEVKDGYNRLVFIPQIINGYNFTITNTVDEIIMFSTKKNIEFTYLIPHVTGNFAKGNNSIRKEGGIIYVN